MTGSAEAPRGRTVPTKPEPVNVDLRRGSLNTAMELCWDAFGASWVLPVLIIAASTAATVLECAGSAVLRNFTVPNCRGYGCVER
ncbi:MAG: hypothetical protein FRX49_01282 [Trebouxia sp. A1-2]|nr:MAG: hypothetical protein FRX49_01282 [Trebouxia sp. A1-2]